MRILQTITHTNDHVSGLLLRLTLGIVILPHGLQLLLGWFGGYGFNGSMQYFTGVAGLPWLVAFTVIMLQSVGAVLLLTGTGTRLMAIAYVIMFIGMIVTAHSDYGFFMNWDGNQKGEGYEYHLLVIGLALLLVINGAGKFSFDYFASKSRVQQPVQNIKL
ncbi:DoxX family protein [Lacibacter sediminis]|uniref:DoxX family protein n=1 Tax=Lacibacter sediminis TaxID=2760713 RepID=A0A7G5XKD9_9BACT|nr:DoxX family protein [Lacibacter sediminis]QNA45942.1 DoxX family protein [Lacibacter sediminis]